MGIQKAMKLAYPQSPIEQENTLAQNHLEIGSILNVNNPCQTLLEENQNFRISKKFTSIETRWESYLEDLPQISQGKFNTEYVALIKKVRSQLHNFLGCPILPPDVAEGEDGGLQLTWEKEHYLLTVDLISSENTEWFFKDRNTGKFWGAEEVAVSDFPPTELLEKLIVWK